MDILKGYKRDFNITYEQLIQDFAQYKPWIEYYLDDYKRKSYTVPVTINFDNKDIIGSLTLFVDDYDINFVNWQFAESLAVSTTGKSTKLTSLSLVKRRTETKVTTYIENTQEIRLTPSEIETKVATKIRAKTLKTRCLSVNVCPSCGGDTKLKIYGRAYSPTKTIQTCQQCGKIYK